MEKIFKKSLALVLSAALCLTALVGCLTVSAEGITAKPTYALGAVEGKPGDTVTVTATISNLNKVCAEHIKLTFPAGLAIGDITDGNGGVYTRLTETTDVTDPDLVGLYSKTTTADNGTLIQFVDFVNWPKTDGTYDNVIESLVIKFAATISTEAEAGHVYAITAAVDAADYDADKLMDVDITNGSVTVTTATVCEHEWQFVDDAAVPATADGNGSITFKCTKCEETKVETVLYYNNYRAAFTSAAYDSEICLQFAARKDRLAEQGDYSDAYMLFSRDAASGSVVSATNIAKTTDTLNGSNKRPCKTWSYPVRSIELTDVVTTNVFVCVNGVWYNGAQSSYSVETYALSALTSVTESEQKLIANMLTYGAKMQIYKGYKTDSLADANLGSYASLVTTTTPEMNNTTVDNHLSTDVYINKYGFAMDARTVANFFFRSDRYSGENKSDYKVVVSWTDKDGAAKSISYYPESNTNAEYTYGPEMQNGVPRENRYTFTFDSLKSFDYRRNFTIEIYDGETEVSHGYTTNFESLIANGISKGGYGQLEIDAYYAMMNYGDASVNHFAK